MKMKSKLIAMMSGLTLAFTGVVGSYAYFTVEKTAGENKISMGNFPKAKVKIFASAGPVYSNAFGSGSNSATGNYNTWLDNASKYAMDNMLGNNAGILGSGKNKFENLQNNSTVNIRNNIGTFGEKNNSWQGSKGINNKEHGTMVHYVVAIFNDANNSGEGRRKLNYKNENVEIQRYDTFEGTKSKNKYTLRKENNISLNGKEERIRTFDWDGSKFVQDGQHGKPSEDADLIIFDIGAEGYYTKGKGQIDLNRLNNTLIGKRKLFDWKGNIVWDEGNPLWNLANQMKGKDEKAKLLNSVCNVSFRYNNDNNYVLSDKYIINMTGSIKEVTDEEELNELNDNNQNIEENLQDVDNKDKEENKKLAEEVKPVVPENDVKPEIPNNNETNKKPENIEKPQVNLEEENKNPEEETNSNNENEINKEELNKDNS